MPYKRSSVLSQELTDYLIFRRAGGVKMEKEYVFNNFDAHLIENHYESKIPDREIVMSFCSLTNSLPPSDDPRTTGLSHR